MSFIINSITNALNSNVQSTINVVIEKTKYIFSLDYKGLLVLIPTYIIQIEKVFKANSNFDDKIKIAAMTILGSLVCIPDRFHDYEVSSVGKNPIKMKMKDIKQKVQDILLAFIEGFKMNMGSKGVVKSSEKIIRKAICYANIVIYQEAANPKRNVENLKVIPLIT